MRQLTGAHFTAFNSIYGTTAPVPNLTRFVVQGSTSVPSSWVRLTVDPQASELFEIEIVPVDFQENGRAVGLRGSAARRFTGSLCRDPGGKALVEVGGTWQ